MDKHSKGYLLLQEIRDESHRFAITAQRKKKKKALKNLFLMILMALDQSKKIF